MIPQLGSTEWTSTAACEFNTSVDVIEFAASLLDEIERTSDQHSLQFSSFGPNEFRLKENLLMRIHDLRTRPGERVAKRRRCKTKVGASHRINQQETIKWFKNRFEGIVRGDRS